MCALLLYSTILCGHFTPIETPRICNSIAHLYSLFRDHQRGGNHQSLQRCRSVYRAIQPSSGPESTMPVSNCDDQLLACHQTGIPRQYHSLLRFPLCGNVQSVGFRSQWRRNGFVAVLCAEYNFVFEYVPAMVLGTREQCGVGGTNQRVRPGTIIVLQFSTIFFQLIFSIIR